MVLEYAVEREGGTLLSIEASPGSAISGLDGVNPWRRTLRVKVTSQARDGRANEELVDIMAKALSIPRADVRLVKGSRSHMKKLFVPLPVEEVESRLGMS